jgi:hypothetical protein
MSDADRVDIVKIERMPGNRVQERSLFGAATCSIPRWDCRSTCVERGQPANHRLMPPAIDGGYGILNAKRGLLGVRIAQPVRRGNEPRQTAGEIADHIVLHCTALHCTLPDKGRRNQLSAQHFRTYVLEQDFVL